MTQDDILRMAQEAGCGWAHNGTVPVITGELQIMRFANIVAAAEREACAKVCEQMSSKFATSRLELLQCLGESLQDAADNIRARGEK